MRALVVDDDSTGRLLLQTFLSRYGECHVAVNGKEAVDAYRAARQAGQGYDLICMDIMMPEVDGLSALRKIRGMEEVQGLKSDQRVRIVMTTAVDDRMSVLTAFHQLSDAYLTKPIDTQKLLAYLQSFKLAA